MYSSSNHYVEPISAEKLARYGFQRTDAFFDNKEHEVLEAEYTSEVTDEEKAINDPAMGLVIAGPWAQADDTAKAQGQDEEARAEEPSPSLGWVCTEQGVFDGRSGQMDFICAPLKVTQQVVTHGKYYRELRLRNFAGEDMTLQIPEGELHGTSKSLVKLLANHGLYIVPDKGNQLRDYLHASGQMRIAHGVEEPGWLDDIGNGLIYLMPDRKLIMAPQLRVTTSVVPAATFATTPLPVQGTPVTWRTEVAQPACHIKAGILALSLGFAPLLLKFAPEEINFTIHFFGLSTKGKSTLLRIAGSIWGDPKKTLQSWNGTEKGLLDVAKQHRDRPLFLDEIGAGNHSPEELIKMIYSLAGGQSRIRSTASGKVLGGEAFRSLVTSTGEYALYAGMSVRGKQPNRGTLHRGIDIEIVHAAEELPEEARKPYLHRLNIATTTAYGTAAKAFLHGLVGRFQHADQLKEYVIQEVEGVMAEFALPSADPVISRGLSRFALLAVAGELAVQQGLIPLADAKAVRAAIKPFAEAWYRQMSPAATQAKLIDRIASFILKSERRFQPVGKPIPADRVGWVFQSKRSQQTFYAFTKEGLQEAAQERDVLSVAKNLVAYNLLVITEPGKYVSKIPVYATNESRPRAYLVKGEIINYTNDLS